MNMTTRESTSLETAFRQPANDIVGMVDTLLAECRGHHLQLDWAAGRCRVRSDGADWFSIPLRQSVFRAMLARVAVLCSDHGTPQSPYGGRGKIAAGDLVVYAVFNNTPDEQRLDLTGVDQHGSGSSNGESPANR